jgi:hypothetical protein
MHATSVCYLVVHCYADGHTYEVEFVSADGRTVALLTVTDADIRPLHQNEILHARPLLRV